MTEAAQGPAARPPANPPPQQQPAKAPNAPHHQQTLTHHGPRVGPFVVPVPVPVPGPSVVVPVPVAALHQLAVASSHACTAAAAACAVQPGNALLAAPSAALSAAANHVMILASQAIHAPLVSMAPPARVLRKEMESQTAPADFYPEEEPKPQETPAPELPALRCFYCNAPNHHIFECLKLASGKRVFDQNREAAASEGAPQETPKSVEQQVTAFQVQGCRTSVRGCNCGASKSATFGFPGEPRAAKRWCAVCRPPGAVNIVSKRKCECGKHIPSFGMPGEDKKNARWCSKCRPEGSVDIVSRRCECGKASPSFAPPLAAPGGDSGEGGCQVGSGLRRGDARWCSKCPGKVPGAVTVVGRSCVCGKGLAKLGILGTDCVKKWCHECPTRPVDAVDLFSARKTIARRQKRAREKEAQGGEEGREGLSPGDRAAEAGAAAAAAGGTEEAGDQEETEDEDAEAELMLMPAEG